jgi:acyl carrier protein
MLRQQRLTHPEIVARVAGLAAEQLGVRVADIDVDAPLCEIGLDSLMVLALVLDVEQAFGVDLDCFEALQVPTLRRMAGMVDLARVPTPALLF